MHAVMEAWRRKLRDYHVPGEASIMLGAKLAALVCTHMWAVFRAHRRALKNNVEYCARTRHPPLNMDGSGGESATEDDHGMQCIDGAVENTTPLSTGLPVY
jgi:hypothetical protein